MLRPTQIATQPTPIEQVTPAPQPTTVIPVTPTVRTSLSPTAAQATPRATTAAGSPSPAATPISPVTPTPAANTLAQLLQVAVPIREPITLTEQIKKPGVKVQPTVNATPPDYQVGNRLGFWVGDFNTNTNFAISATLRYKTDVAYFWVEDGANYDQAALERSAKVFSDKIYPTNRQLYGNEWNPGIDNDPRLHILHARTQGPVAGYFSTADEYPRAVNPFSNEKEAFVMNLRALQPGSPQYESTLAHEFQHMIEWNRHRNQDEWLNEGMSVLAERLNGYGGQEFFPAFSQNPDVQLNDWSDQSGANAPHYGAASLLTNYLYDRFGEGILKAILDEPCSGIEGLDNVLQRTDPALSFDSVFRDWVAANYLNASGQGARFGYETITVKPRVAGSITQVPGAYEDQVKEFGTDYINLNANAPGVRIEFQGHPTVKVIPADVPSGKYFWWSNRADEAETSLTHNFDLRNVRQATLKMRLWYDIEDGWDYGYVLASADNGATWKTLANAVTTDKDPNGNNLGQGLTGKSGGNQGGPQWIDAAFDLTPFAGRQIQIRYLMTTDGAVNLNGMGIDDISIPEINFSDNAEQGDNGWVTRGFARIDNTLPQIYAVQVLLPGQPPQVQTLQVNQQGYATLDLKDNGSGLKGATIAVSGMTPFTTQETGYKVTVSPLQ
ncbi:MAG: immune inhibitor A [Chloroflexi bacterium]|nr:immune inhibitor A [Chloroflexota bacterium]